MSKTAGARLASIDALRGLTVAAMLLVAATGWGQEEDRRRALEAGFDRHVTKPMDATELAQSLTRWLADKRNACDTVSCLRKAYRQRLKYFEGPPHYAYSEHAE